jgi:multiple sugar transport system permease protein
LVAFFTFVAQWNNYFLPLLVLPSSNNYPLPVGLSLLAASDVSLSPGNYSADQIYNPDVALAAVLAMVPVVIALLLAQRVVVRGASLMSGSFVG